MQVYSYAEFLSEQKKFLKTDDGDIDGYVSANADESFIETIKKYLTSKKKSDEDTFSSFSAETERKIKLWCRTLAKKYDLECVFIVSEDAVYAYSHDLTEYKARKQGKMAGEVAKLDPKTIENEDTLKKFCSIINNVKGKESIDAKLTTETKFEEL